MSKFTTIIILILTMSACNNPEPVEVQPEFTDEELADLLARNSTFRNNVINALMDNTGFTNEVVYRLRGGSSTDPSDPTHVDPTSQEYQPQCTYDEECLAPDDNLYTTFEPICTFGTCKVIAQPRPQDICTLTCNRDTDCAVGELYEATCVEGFCEIRQTSLAVCDSTNCNGERRCRQVDFDPYVTNN